MKNKKIKILLADDNECFCEMIKAYILTQKDMELSGVVSNGNEAIDHILHKKPEYILLDINMPGLNGIETLKQIKSMNLSYKPIFIVISAVNSNEVINDAIQFGAVYYFLKPFNIKRLFNFIREINLYRVK